jgi:F-type H+-transporting ATPase subunit epsilon
LENSFRLEIISPVRTVFDGEISSVVLPGTSGSFQVLKNHAPLVSSLGIGIVRIQNESGEVEYTTGGGVFEVRKNKAIILAESIESKEELDIERAKLSKARSEQILNMTNVRDDEKLEARVSLQRALNRIKLAEKK